jgi:uncharacterized protein YndB with AHSA1/START domain
MARNQTHIPAPPERVFQFLSDGWKYAEWVVGAKHIRSVDETWPAPGAKFHHTVGVGPLKLRDSTQVMESEPPRRLVLHARARPAGVAEVTLTLEPEGAGTRIKMVEKPIRGVAAALNNPFLEGLTFIRNIESLRRLKKRVLDGDGASDSSRSS